MLPSQVYRKPKACTKLRQGCGCSPRGFSPSTGEKDAQHGGALRGLSPLRTAAFVCAPSSVVGFQWGGVFAVCQPRRNVLSHKKARACGSRTRTNVHKRHVWYNWRRVLGAPATPITSPARGYKTGLVVQFAAFLCQWGLCALREGSNALRRVGGRRRALLVRSAPTKAPVGNLVVSLCVVAKPVQTVGWQGATDKAVAPLRIVSLGRLSRVCDKRRCAPPLTRSALR